MENKIKRKLEYYESRLPENDLAEFRALLDNTKCIKNRTSTTYFAWLIPSAISVVLALLLFFRHNFDSDRTNLMDADTIVIQVVDQPEPVDCVKDAGISSEPGHPRWVKQSYSVLNTSETKPDVIINAERTEENILVSTVEENKDFDNYNSFLTEANSDMESSHKPVDISEEISSSGKTVGKAAISVLGCSGIAALASMLTSSSTSNNNFSPSPVDGPLGTITEQGDDKTGHNTHYIPLRVGLSLRVPIDENWSLTTGLDYSLYSSRIGYTLSPDKRQNVHYLGIPIRADFTIARNNLLDVYIGSGISADLCVAAFEENNRIEKDGIGFSMVGSGGIRLNITEHVGLYLEPTISWNMPSRNRVLDTYKTEHPLMFSVSSGLRITVPVIH